MGPTGLHFNTMGTICLMGPHQGWHEVQKIKWIKHLFYQYFKLEPDQILVIYSSKRTALMGRPGDKVHWPDKMNHVAQSCVYIGSF